MVKKEKTKKAPNKWLIHVKAEMKKSSNKGKKFKDVLKEAKKTYKK